MEIEVQLFSILRECLPTDTKAQGHSQGKAIITLPEGATLADLITELGIDQYLGYPPAELTTKAGWQFMVSGRFAPDVARVLQDGEQVRVFPPVSGG